MPDIQDFVQGIDLTGRTSVTPAELLQLLSSAYPHTDKGIVILSSDTGVTPNVPNATVTTKWKNYIWIRRLATSVITYVWNDTAATDVVYLKWQSITVSSIGSGSITNAMIGDAVVTSRNIVSVNWTAVEGEPSFLLPTEACTGDLLGSTFAAMAVKSNGITGAKLSSDASVDANRAVGTDHIKANAVTLPKIALGTIAKQILRVKAVAADGWELVTNYFSQLDTLGTALQVPRTNAGASAIEWFTPTGASGGIVKSSTIEIPLVAATTLYTSDAIALGGVPSGCQLYFKNLGNLTLAGYTIGDLIANPFPKVDGSGVASFIYYRTSDDKLRIILRNTDFDLATASGGAVNAKSNANFCADFSLYIVVFRFQ